MTDRAARVDGVRDIDVPPRVLRDALRVPPLDGGWGRQPVRHPLVPVRALAQDDRPHAVLAVQGVRERPARQGQARRREEGSCEELPPRRCL